MPTHPTGGVSQPDEEEEDVVEFAIMGGGPESVDDQSLTKAVKDLVDRANSLAEARPVVSVTRRLCQNGVLLLPLPLFAILS